MAQYIVAVMLDASLNVDACGPFRSLERAEEVRDRINEAGAWTDHPDVEGATIIAQVVTLRPVADLVDEARPPL